jgi:hypothetical protein
MNAREVACLALGWLVVACTSTDAAAPEGTPDVSMSGMPDAGAVRACDALTTPPVVKACARWEMDGDAGVDADAPARYPSNIALTGTVEEIANGSWSCSSALGRGDFYSQLGGWPRQFRVSDGQRSVWVGVLLPWKTPLAAAGDRVTVEYAFLNQLSGIRWNQFVVRREDGSALIWVADAPATKSLRPPAGILVGDGSDSCIADQGSGPVTRRGYLITAGGDETRLGYGMQADVGGYVALHLGNEQQQPGTGPSCADCFGAHHAGLAMVRGTLEDLAAPR